jgi:hypothetical protein
MKYFIDIPKIEFEINLKSDLIKRISEFEDIILDFIKNLNKMKKEIDNINNILKSIRDTVNTVELRQ